MSETTATMTPSLQATQAGAVTWFEIGTPDPEGARRFYGDLFGWTFTPEGQY